MANEKVLLLDTTLRDGEQSAGIGMTGAEKMEIARQLQRMNVDIIEAGFAASSPGDFEAVSNIAREVKGTDHRFPGPGASQRRRPGLASGRALGAASHPRVPLLLGDTPDAPAPQEP